MNTSPDQPEPEDDDRSRGEVESGFLRQMLRERRFLVAVVILTVICVVAVLGIPKIWNSTPSGFEPEVKVSWLDRLQARSLAKTARKEDAAGRAAEAVQAWRGAIANDLGNPEYSRGLLQTIVNHNDPGRRNLSVGAQQGFWLLRLSGTNVADTGLLARFCEKYALDDLAVSLLMSQREKLGPEQLATLGRAVYRQGNMELFGALWKENASVLEKDPILRVYYNAWQIGWGPASGISSGQAALNQAMADPQTAAVAHQVSLTLASARLDPEDYRRSLDYLEDRHIDTPGQHASYWGLLVRVGRSTEARELAHRHSSAPQTPHELSQMAEVLTALNLRNDAITLLQRHLPTFSYHTLLWAQLAELLIAESRWTEVRSLGVEIRNDLRQRVEIPGYGWFLEGLGAAQSFLPDQANLAFSQMQESHISEPLIGYRCAIQLQSLGRAEDAKRLLEGLERNFGGKADYWFRLGVAAYQSDDIRLMLSANEKAHELNPGNQVIINNLAAALLMLRENPAKAAQLTLRRLAQKPDDEAARINHLLALVLNRRTEEARPILSTLAPDQLNLLEATLVRYAMFEIAIIEGDSKAALAVYPLIEKRFLKSAQLEWVDGAYRKLQLQN